VRALIGLASVLLVISITANWVQKALLDTQQVQDSTNEILADHDVQAALSEFTVEQLYANVDVQGQIQQRLPSSAQALAVPVAALTRQLATDVAERALASPRVQELVSTAVGRAHGEFVSLIRDENQYVSTTGGEVKLEYGDLVADLATRLGVDPATIANIRSLVQDFSQNLREGLTNAQTRVRTVRAALAEASGGELSPQARQELKTLRSTLVDLHRTVVGLEKKAEAARDKVPSQLQERLSELDHALIELDGRLVALQRRIGAVLARPTQANAARLDSPLAELDGRITSVLGRPVVQTPGELVVMKSDQLDGMRTLVGALRNLGFVLPLLVLFLYLVALYLAKGWRREALIAVGAGILFATLAVLIARRLLGTAVVDSISGSETVKPAVRSVWDIVSGSLRERALFVLVIGLVFIGAGVLAGPGRRSSTTRRFLAPYLRDHAFSVYAVVAVLFLLWLSFLPGITNLGQVLTIIVLAVLAVVGIEVLRRQTAREFPP
jgi:hypothetical protein